MNGLRRAALATALAGGLAVLRAAAAPQAGSPVVPKPALAETDVVARTLANGLTAIAVDRPASGQFDAVTACLVGYAFDPPGGSGTSHLVEHFLADPVLRTIGPPRELISELTREYEKAGGQDSARTKALEAQMASWKATGRWNIGTSADLVHYGVMSYPAAGIERYIAAVERTLRMVPQANMELHRASLLKELRELERDPRHAMLSVNAVATFGDHPYGVPTGGRVEDVQRMTLETLQQFVASYYSPDRCVLAVVGDVRPARALDLAERFLGTLPRKPAALAMRKPTRAEGERRFAVASIAGPRVLVNFLKPPPPAREDNVAAVVASLLSGNGAWSLQGALTGRRNLARQSWCSNGGAWQLADNPFTLGAEAEPGVELDEVEAAIVSLVDRLSREPVAEADVQAAIRRLLDQPFADGSDFALGVRLAQGQLAAGDWRALWRGREAWSRVTAADITAFAQKYLIPANRTVVLLLPESK